MCCCYHLHVFHVSLMKHLRALQEEEEDMDEEEGDEEDLPRDEL